MLDFFCIISCLGGMLEFVGCFYAWIEVIKS